MKTDQLSRLLDAERGASPSTEAASRGLERLLGDLTAQVAPLPIATGSLKLGLSLVPKWLVVGFALGLGGAGAVAQLAAPVVSASAPSPRPSALASVATPSRPTETVLPPAPTALEAPSAPPARPAPRSPANVESSSAPTFDAELRLITLAKQELERGKPHLARAWLDEHAQRYSGGVFAVEREALRVLVSCAQRREPSLARQFTNMYPGSALGERLLRSCSVEPAASPSAVEFPK